MFTLEQKRRQLFGSIRSSDLAHALVCRCAMDVVVSDCLVFAH